jgi:hypothetical protein
MRQLFIAAFFAIFVSATNTIAAEPASQVAPGQPLLLMASATTRDGAVTLHLRTVQMEAATQETITRTPVKETILVNGRVVEQTRLVEERRQTTVLRPVPGPAIDAPLDGLEVSVQDLKGKPVTPANVARLLKKETAVLVSVSGPVDPYYLQTTKLGTLIVQMPAQVLNAPPAELLPPTKIDPAEPRISPARPKPVELIPQAPIDPTEPPLAPAKPKAAKP